MNLLLDEPYGARLAAALRRARIEASTLAELRMTGAPDPDVFAIAVRAGQTLLRRENVADFARLAADHVSAGRHHDGVLIALSSRFSHRSAGRPAPVAAIRAVADDPLRDRVVYLRPLFELETS